MAYPDDDIAGASKAFDPYRSLATIVLAAVTIAVLYFVVTNPRFQWDIVAKYLFAPSILAGLAMSLTLTVMGMAIGLVLGVVAAVLIIGTYMPGRWVAQGYVWLFRGAPLLIQLIFWYNLAYLVPTVTFGIPFTDLSTQVETNVLITPFTAAILGLGLNEGAYMTEIVRAGLLSVDPRQRDAARAIGMTPTQTFFRIVFPQAMRFIIPPTGSQIIGMVKATALVSVIAMNDLLFAVQAIYNRTFEVVPLLIVGVIWYLVVISVLYLFQSRLERFYSRGQSRTPEKRGLLARLASFTREN